MYKVMAYGTFELPKMAQNGFRWIQEYYFPVLYEALLHISFDTCIIFIKY